MNTKVKPRIFKILLFEREIYPLALPCCYSRVAQRLRTQNTHTYGNTHSMTHVSLNDAPPPPKAKYAEVVSAAIVAPGAHVEVSDIEPLRPLPASAAM